MGVNLNLYDYDEINRFLREQIVIWKKEEKLEISIKESIRKYERKNLTQMLITEFNQLFIDKI